MKPHFLSFLFLAISMSAAVAADGVVSGTPMPAQSAPTYQPARPRRVQPSPQQNPGRVRPDHSPIILNQGNANRLHNNRRAIEQGMVRPELVNPSRQRVKTGNGDHDRRQGQLAWSDAMRHYRHERHDRTWWCEHYRVIVFVNSAYYYWDTGYWYPAWGYDPVYDSYDYDGPIYTYGNLLPDQVILNVQRALQEDGYYGGPLSGSLNTAARQALAAFQEDNGLYVTGAIDEATVDALGLLGD